jgi:hypothetical protein
MTWEKLNEDREMLEMDGFWISFNRNPGGGVRMFRSDTDNGETALCRTEADGDTKFYILNGDFRKEYSELADKGFQACKDFFDSKEEHRSSWTSGEIENDSN